MSKYKRILLAVTKEGMSQSEIAASLHVSKRDVSAAAKVAREHSLTFDQVSAMAATTVDDAFFPREGRGPDPAYLRPDMAALVERKKRNRRLPVKMPNDARLAEPGRIDRYLPFSDEVPEACRLAAGRPDESAALPDEPIVDEAALEIALTDS